MIGTGNNSGITSTYVSSGTVAKPTITYNVGLGTVTIGEGSYRFFHNTDYSGSITQHTIAETTLPLTDDITSYIVANYNSGTPEIAIITDITAVQDAITAVVYTVYRNGDSISVIDWDAPGLGLSNKLHQRFIETERFSRAYGLDIGEFGTRNVNIAAGKVWEGSFSNSLQAVDSTVDEVYLLTNNGDGTFANTPVTAYPNTQYDNKSGTLQTLTDGNYAVVWVYRSMDHDSKRIYFILANQEHDLNSAIASQPVEVPPSMSTNGLLLGRIITLKGDATATEIDSAFSSTYAGSTTTSHGGLTGLTGGYDGTYDHLPVYMADEITPVFTVDKVTKVATAHGDFQAMSFGSKFYNVSTQVFETAVVNREYYSPNQHGGRYGTVYRRYHNSASNGGYISISGITKLVDYGGTFNGDNVYHGATTDAPDALYLYRGTDRVTFTISGWTLETGWLDYTK